MKLDMIGIVVADMAKSLRFYRALGWTTPDPEPGSPYHEITLSNGLRISWNDLEMVRSIEQNWEQPVGQRLGLAFLCDSVADVDAAYSNLTGLGFHGHKQPWDAFWGQRYAQIEDPDGNVVDMFCPLEKGS